MTVNDATHRDIACRPRCGYTVPNTLWRIVIHGRGVSNIVLTRSRSEEIVPGAMYRDMMNTSGFEGWRAER
jgi:hypothetical protein